MLGLPRGEGVKALTRLIEGASPFARETLGVKAVRFGPEVGRPRALLGSPGSGSHDDGAIGVVPREDITIRLPFNDLFVGNPQMPCMHGGVVAALLDHTAGFTAWAALPGLGFRLSTVNIRVDYIAPAPCEDHLAVGTLVHAGKKIITADAVVFPESNPGQLVAVARGTFAVNRLPDGTCISEWLQN